MPDFDREHHALAKKKQDKEGGKLKGARRRFMSLLP